MKTKVRNSISGLLLIPLVLACFALLPSVQATPDPGAIGGGNSNAADGFGALNATVSGINNSGFGANALHNLTTGNNNAAQGNSAQFSLTDGDKNTALGVLALRLNVSGDDNTAVGYKALYNNTNDNNVAVGTQALYLNTDGDSNTALGFQALFSNDSIDNVAVGFQALVSNTGGARNTAVGITALLSNTEGNFNTAVGEDALVQNTGSANIALGASAGTNLTTGSNNICIGNVGVGGESSTIRVGNATNHTATFIAGISGASAASGVGVFVTAAGKLGTVTSSARFKDAIKPMDKTSEAILALKPVTFRYKHELDPDGIPQFGLVAEDVEKVNPDLVARDDKGRVYTVRYDAVNAMLLNEFLKEHKKVEELKNDFQATVAQQQKEIQALTASLKEQAAQIQKVSAQLEASKTAPQVVNNP